MTLVIGYNQFLSTQTLAGYGEVLAIESFGSQEIVLITSSNNRIILRGRFDYSSD